MGPEKAGPGQPSTPVDPFNLKPRNPKGPKYLYGGGGIHTPNHDSINST